MRRPEEDLSLALSSGPLSSKGLLRLGLPGREGCWMFGFPWGCPEGLGDKCKPERCFLVSCQKKTGKIQPLPCPTDEKSSVKCLERVLPTAKELLEEALASRELRTNHGARLKQRREVIWSRSSHLCLTLQLKRTVTQFCFSVCRCCFFNSLGFYFVLEIWTIISFSVYTASDISLKKQHLKILATYPSAIFLRLGPCMSMFFCKLCLLQYSFIVCILSNTLERKCSKTFTQYKITISLVNC